MFACRKSKPSYKFYDSDADSMMERDFPVGQLTPKDELRERKLLRKKVSTSPYTGWATIWTNLLGTI